ncbi:MAG: hypothetical protein E7307_03115 [Butyrivibrio sp.]|nr:hypothetical protein [Butyrivibrio sp.]
MNKTIRTILGIALSVFMLASMPAVNSFAYGADTEVMDFQDSVITVEAGSSYTMGLRSTYDYTYYIKGSTSKATRLEASFKSGTQKITFHVGADETAKTMDFYFYVVDDRLQTTDKWDVIQVNVKPGKPAAAASVTETVSLANGKTGSVVKIGDVAMMNNESGVGMASFSLSDGKGHMVPFNYKGIANNGSANYFKVASSLGYASPKISESDKAVMLANGYAGVCVNGTCKNWP